MKNLFFVAVVLSIFSVIGCQGVIDVSIEPQQESGFLDPCSLPVGQGIVVDYGHTERALAGSLPKPWYYVQVNTCYGNVFAWVGPYGSEAQRDFDQFWGNCPGGQIVVTLVEEPGTGEWKIGNGQYWCY